MTKTSRIFAVLFTLLTITTSSCKKEKVEGSKLKNEEPIVVLPPEKDSGTNETAYLPVRLGSGGLKITFGYNDNQSLSKIDYTAEGCSIQLSFDAGNYPLQLKKFNGETLTYLAEYTLDENNKVVRSDQYDIVNKQYILTGYYTIAYNNNQQPERITHFNPRGVKLNERQRSYDPSGNLLREVGSSPAHTFNYLYDTKNAVFKNAGYAWLFALETGDDLLLSQLNNIIQADASHTGPGNPSFSYVYNTHDYPQSMTMTVDGNALTYAIVYQ
jgi:hypothetical protein